MESPEGSVQRRQMQYQLDLLDDATPDYHRAPRLFTDPPVGRGGNLATGVPFRVHVWQFGAGKAPLRLVALTGEPVVDYSLKFKRHFGWDNTWVSGYNNELLSYVPSERILSEGHYEGTTGMAEYRHPSMYAPGIESRITKLVLDLAHACSNGCHSSRRWHGQAAL